jgi:filamentous hemagglutinin
MADTTISGLTNTNTIDGATVVPADYSGATYKVTANTLGSFITTNAVTVTATGNITGGNILTGGLISSTGTVTGSSHLGSVVSVTANITGGNLLTGGLISATGGITAASLTLGSGSSNAGSYSATGNITGGNLLTGGLISSTGTITGSSHLGSVVSATGNVTGGNILTGGLISAAATITGGNLATGGTSSATGNITGGNILTAGLISATSTITSAANITGGNILTAGLISATGNVSGNFFIGNGSQLTGLPATYGNANVVANVAALGSNPVSSTGNVTGGNLLTGGQISASGNINTSGYFVGNFAGNITGNLTVPGSNTQVLYNANGNAGASAGLTFASDANLLSVTGNLNANNGMFTNVVNVASFTGAVVSVTGNIYSGNLQSSGTTGAKFSILGSTPTTANTTGGALTIQSGAGNGANVGGTITIKAGNSGSSTEDTQWGGDVLVYAGNTTGASGRGGNIRIYAGQGNGEATFSGLVQIVGGRAEGGSGASGGQLILYGGTGNLLGYAGQFQLLSGTSFGTNKPGQDSLIKGSLGTGSGTPGNILIQIGTALASGNTAQTGSNIVIIDPSGMSVTGTVSATGNITGNYILGDGSQLTGLPDTYGNANVVANLAALGSNPVSTTGNVTGGNLLTGGVISSTGNIFAGNIIVIGGFYDTGDHLVTSTAANANIVLTPTGTGITQNNGAFSASGNVTGGNVLTGGLVSATGNITGGNITTSGAGGAISGSGNITAGNVLTGGLISATSTITSAANIAGGNIVTGGLLSATGNVLGNVFTVNLGNTTTAIINGGGNAVGNIGSSSKYFNQVFAQATTALYADLAEIYSADAEYAPGTVVSFGGDQEVTKSITPGDPRVAGVISEKPSYLMNSGLQAEHRAAVALTGRVPTLVIGPVRKGDMMVSAGNGWAQACVTPAMGTVIGKALTNFDGDSGIIEIVVGRM